jgi:hypothetical protein
MVSPFDPILGFPRIIANPFLALFLNLDAFSLSYLTYNALSPQVV